MGDHVKVLAGRYEGDTGLIVRVEDNMAVLFSDLTMHEVGGILENILLETIFEGVSNRCEFTKFKEAKQKK